MHPGMQADRPLSSPSLGSQPLNPLKPLGLQTPGSRPLPPSPVGSAGLRLAGRWGPGKGRLHLGLAACSVPAQAAYPRAACGSEGTPDLSGCLGPGPAAGWGRGARGRCVCGGARVPVGLRMPRGAASLFGRAFKCSCAPSTGGRFGTSLCASRSCFVPPAHRAFSGLKLPQGARGQELPGLPRLENSVVA